MTMTETPVPATPKKRAKPRKKKVMKMAKPKAAEPATEEYPGLTVQDCAKACNADGCVISGKSYCGHPRKGGQCDRNDSAAVERLNKAQKQLAVNDAAGRFS